jgi:hypothetical protein
MPEEKAKRKCLDKLEMMIKKYKNTITAIIGLISVLLTCILLVRSCGKSEPICFGMHCETPWIYFNVSDNMYRIRQMEICLNDKMTKQVIVPDLREYNFTLGDLDSLLTILKSKISCDSFAIPIIIKSKYFAYGKPLEDQSEYIAYFDSHNNYPFEVDYVKHLSDKYSDKIKFKYLIKCKQ